MYERPELPSHNPTMEIVDRDKPSHEPAVARIGNREQAEGTAGRLFEQTDVVRIAAHDAVHGHDFGRLDRIGHSNEVAGDAPHPTLLLASACLVSSSLQVRR